MHIAQLHAAGGIKIALLHGINNIFRRQPFGPHLHPTSPRHANLLRFVVIVRIVGGHAVHHAEAQLAQPQSQHNIPNSFCAAVQFVPFVSHAAMPVVNLKKLLPFHLCQIFRRNGPTEIGMVQVGEHGLPCLATLFQHGPHIVLHHFQHAVAGLGRNNISQVGGTQMDGKFAETVGYFFAGNQQKTVGFFKQMTKFRQRLKPHL